ncbi:MAG: MFS transporter [Propionibacteriales bacterium]|nr:MFS transporter [Propionibacteriales bacterium]
MRLLLGLAAVAVAFAAADTYVVVLSLPDMMASAGLSVEELQRAAPIISGFLLGYVALLPLVGRIADLRGRLPVLVVSLLVFGFGSLVTAAAYDLPSLVAGRFLQGVGGGGLVPVTLALVADIYPAERRGVPLGIVGAVQELGSVIGPLYGAVVLAVGDWRDIFWINLAVGLVLAAGISALRNTVIEPVEIKPMQDRVGRAASVGDGGRAASEASDQSRPDQSRPLAAAGRPDLIGLTLLALWITAILLVMRQPHALVTSVRWGGPFVPFGDGGSIWWSQVGLVAIGLGILLAGWVILAPRPFFDAPDWWRTVRQADLGGVSAVAAVAFAWRQRRVDRPLVPRGSLARRPAWAALLVSFFVGAALIAALVDVPVFARISVYGDSQVKAALVLVELLVALPVGALVGGYLTRSLPSGAVAAAGMACATVGFWSMSRWDADQLHHHLSSGAVLALTGLGFGLALAPVNAALLASTDDAAHGVTSALLVVSRMVGMLVGISALTTIGLRRYYDVSAGFPSPSQVCGGRTRCDAYNDLLQAAGVQQLHATFFGAAVCALVAGVLAAVLFRGAATRGTSPVLALTAGA